MSRVLTLDTSQLQAALCLVDDGRVVASRTGSIEVAHSEAVLALIDQLLAQSGWSIGDIAAFGVGVGPGSFTGIRIGCATIKALAQVLARPVLPVSSLKALAFSASPNGKAPDVALVNAYQGQIFAGWQDAAGSWREAALTAAEFRRTFAPTGERTVFCGSGAKLYWPEISQIPGSELSPTEFITPQGLLLAISESEPVLYTGLTANYLRPSAAEDKLSALADTKGA